MVLFNISDHPSPNILAKRKAQWRKLIIDDDEKMVRLILTIRFFDNVNGQYGNEIDYQSATGLMPYERILRAHNGNLVNPANQGTPVYATVIPEVTGFVHIEDELDEEGNVITPGYDKPVIISAERIEYRDMETNELLDVNNLMGYYDFFLYVMQNEPTIVMDAIGINIAFEDAMGGLNKLG